MRRLTLVTAILILTVVGVGVLLMVAFGGNPARRGMRDGLLRAAERGGLADLGQAQALGRHLILADGQDREAAAALAFVSAILAVDHGLDTEREAKMVLERSGLTIPTESTAPGAGDGRATEQVTARASSEPEVHAEFARMAVDAPLASVAWSLILLRKGEHRRAARLALAAAAATPGAPYPLYALGRARARGGDPAGAVRALQAAVVGAPAFIPARMALAECRLDMGDAQAARVVLDAVLSKAPGDLRALLLLDEAEQALGQVGTGTLRAACSGAVAPIAKPKEESTERETETGTPPASDRWPPRAIRVGCALADSGRARRSGARTQALAHAEEAAAAVPLDPRLLGRTALVLAQLGAVDRAAALLARAQRMGAREMPILAWAAAAVSLGRGLAAVLPDGPAPADPDNRLLLARAALAAGGAGALGVTLDKLGEDVAGRDVDLLLLSRLRIGPRVPVPGGLPPDDPVRAYVDGMRARLDGDMPSAVATLRLALSGHGDACRAAGEYATMSRILKTAVDPAAWNLCGRKTSGA